MGRGSGPTAVHQRLHVLGFRPDPAQRRPAPSGRRSRARRGPLQARAHGRTLAAMGSDKRKEGKDSSPAERQVVAIAFLGYDVLR